jgi:hypothetical protein
MSAVVFRLRSIPNPFHVLDQNLLPAPVVEFRSPAVAVAGDALSGFKGAVIVQKLRDAGAPERVRRIVSRQRSAALNRDASDRDPLDFVE